MYSHINIAYLLINIILFICSLYLLTTAQKFAKNSALATGTSAVLAFCFALQLLEFALFPKLVYDI